ncbi:UNVERIFIED_CONTAM: hypothetical protein FKN15_020270 [Acipenser sinensis]
MTSNLPHNETDCYALQMNATGPNYFFTGFFCYIPLPYLCEYESVSPPNSVSINLEDVGEENVTLQWEPPQEQIDEYYILVRSVTIGGDSKNYSVNNSNSFELSMLTPGMTYEIGVAAVRNGNMSELKTIQQTLRPKRVQIVVPYELNTHSLVLYVQKPRAGIYDGINVTYKEGSQRTPVSVGGDTITIENLTPGTAYDFFVYTTSVNMASAAYQVPAVKTFPSQVERLNHSKSSDTIAVSWTQAQHVFDGYIVSITNGSFHKEKTLSTKEPRLLLRTVLAVAFLAAQSFSKLLKVDDAEFYSGSTPSPATSSASPPLTSAFSSMTASALPAQFSWTKPITLTVEQLKSYTAYVFEVSAFTNEGEGLIASYMVRMPESAPSAVNGLKALAVDSTSVKLSWKSPLRPNGIITQYRILVFRKPPGILVQNITLTGKTEDLNDSTLVSDAESTSVLVTNLSAEQMSHVIKTLIPFTEYMFSVAASTDVGEGPSTNIIVKTREQVPSSVQGVYYQNITSTSILVSWKPPTNPNGKITHFTVYGMELLTKEAFHKVTNETSIIISGLKKYTEYKLRVAASTGVGESSLSEEDDIFARTMEDEPESAPQNLTVQHVTASTAVISWLPPEKPNGIITYYKVTYAVDTDFHTENSTTTTVTLQNLKPHSVYTISIRAYTKYGHGNQTSSVLKVLTGEDGEGLSSRTVEIILAVALCVLSVILLGAAIYAFARIRQKQKEGGTYSPRDAETIDTKFKLDQLITVADLELKEEKLTRPVNKKSFLQHVEDLCSNDNVKFQEEFSELPKLLQDLATSDADLPWNRSKNRFTNIKPYNNNRVKLIAEAGVPGSDYINASYVSGYLCPNEFIATQGPLPGTVADFWRMIWETRTRTIAMLTQCFEKGRIRCHQYWPEDNKPVTVFGDIVITKLTEDVHPDWTIRDLKVERSILKLIAVSKGMLVFIPSLFCSAGVGRTGVFIGLDHLVQHVSDHDFVDIYGLVAELRSERMCMVQNLAQYMFLHQCALDLLSSKGNSQSIWFVNYSALEKMDSLEAMEGDVELEWEETTM